MSEPTTAATDAYERMLRARDEFIRHLLICAGCADYNERMSK